MKFSCLYTSVMCAFLMTACGGGSSSESSSGETNVTSKTINITVTDGYLSNAQVCADKNKNSICENNEIIGNTNSKGVISIPEQYKQYPLIAKIVSGITTDSDTGLVNKPYELIAPQASTVITPFTTIAMLNNEELSKLAEQLELSPVVVSGDYVTSKSSYDASLAENAVRAHALARSIVKLLPSSIEQFESQFDLEDVRNINSLINDYPVGDLNSVNFVSDGSGSYKAEYFDYKLPLSNYLISNDNAAGWAFLSMNPILLQEEGGIEYLKFNAVQHTGSFHSIDNKIKETFSYSVNDKTDTLTTLSDGETNYCNFIYKSPEIGLIKFPEEGEGVLLLKSINQPKDFLVNAVAGKTFYLIYDGDDSDGEPIAKKDSLVFNSDNTLTVNGQDIGATWSEEKDKDYNVKAIKIEGYGDSLSLVKIIENTQGMMAVANKNGNNIKYYLMTTNSYLADKIYSAWLN